MNVKQLSVIFVLIFSLAFSFSLFADSAEDLRVIKNAVKGKKGPVKYLKVSVQNKKTKKHSVKVKMPLALIEMIAECTDDMIKFDNGCKFDLKKVIKLLKKNGPLALVEVEEDDEIVKVWFE